MAKVILRQKAINDLSDIWSYTSFKWSENQADKYYQSLKLACKEIGTNPNIGKRYYEISGQLLGFKKGRHILFYQVVSESRIEVIRILHEQMDLKSRLKE
ncbi:MULTISPECIES: type II toxin-antitoxin system RelE/ParE family toxin [unclassified Carboxylicivirga]|uniref:type II toxin-antitoxin system RelE/ParE family toxin n=1 Tax=Carboxylicivirga TaxID=1628153 RepID=UPI003D35144E